MEALNHDLIVVGGGPAGTSAAISAARAGMRVVILERGRFPRHKVCGEFVSAESLGLLATLLEGEHASLLRDAIAIPRARVFLDGRILETDVDPAASSIARLDLDAALWQSAIKVGVEARSQTAVHNISGEPLTAQANRSRPNEAFRVATSVGEFKARAVVDASGRWSNLSVQMGTPPEKWLGLKGHFKERDPQRSVDLYFFNGGYCGVQPVDVAGGGAGGRVNAAAMVRADVASSLSQVFGLHPQLRERSQSWQAISEPVSTSPLIFREPETTRGNVLLAGDAAGFVDPFVGDGISLALRSGALAAESLVPFLKGEIELPEAVRRYAQAYAQRLAPVFRASSAIRRLLMLPKAIRIPMLFALENSPAMTRYLVKKTR
jgi:flavin-dependent dehydrogenase